VKSGLRELESHVLVSGESLDLFMVAIFDSETLLWCRKIAPAEEKVYKRGEQVETGLMQNGNDAEAQSMSSAFLETAALGGNSAYKRTPVPTPSPSKKIRKTNAGLQLVEVPCTLYWKDANNEVDCCKLDRVQNLQNVLLIIILGRIEKYRVEQRVVQTESRVWCAKSVSQETQAAATRHV
jgi:hypothetical protein